MPAHAVALVAYALITAILTWPLVSQLGAVVPHDLGDPLLSTWTLWWNAQAVPFTARWWDGLAFFPARNTLTLSDHRLGFGLLTTPLIWSGITPVAAYNVAFLATFVLSAAAAYALAFTLTRSRPASFLSGLVFGFNPYRAEHLAHLELLASYWLPIVLLSLHQWLSTRRTTWLVLLSVSLTLQALTCGYYFFFAGVLIALWLVWFLPRAASPRFYASTLIALAAPLVALGPVLMTYRDAHAAMGLARSIHEIEAFSADLLGLVTAPDLLLLWNSPRDWLRPEGAIFPGAAAVLLTAAAVVARQSRVPSVSKMPLSSRARLVIAAMSIAMAAVAIVPGVLGPVAFDVPGLRISLSAAYKPLTIAALLFVVWLLSSNRVQDAWRRRSPFAFYVLATLAMWLFALGPTARLAGERILYKAPYAWLMALPGFRDEFRAPARFAMLAALTLSAAVALAFCRLSKRGGGQMSQAAAVAVGALVMAESWIHPFPVVAAPAQLQVPRDLPRDAAIAELPFGIFEDGIAMYHSMTHGRRIVNGLSGYDPPHHAVLRAALQDEDYAGLTAIAGYGELAIFLRRDDDEGAERAARLRLQTPARPVAGTSTHEVWLLDTAPDIMTTQPESLGYTLHIRQLTASTNSADAARALDDDRITVWETEHAQEGGEALVADLGAVVDVAGVVLSVGGYTGGFPRAVSIDLSIDSATWSQTWRGSTTAQAVAAALANPTQIPVVLAFAPTRARYVRITQLARSGNRWAVSELRIVGRAAAPPPPGPPPRSR